MPPPHHKQLKRQEIPNQARFLTFSCYQRLPLFNNDKIKDSFVDHLESTRTRTQFKLFAWVIMPEHIHLLIWPDLPDYPASKVAWHLKRNFAKEIIARWKELDAPILSKIRIQDDKHRFWQPGGGYDRNIIDSHELPEKISYIHSNPVRRKLVTHPEDWNWSSAKWYAGDRDNQLPIDDIKPPN